MTKVLRMSYLGRRGMEGEIPRQARIRRYAPIRGPTPKRIYARGELEAGPIYVHGTSWKLLLYAREASCKPQLSMHKASYQLRRCI